MTDTEKSIEEQLREENANLYKQRRALHDEVASLRVDVHQALKERDALEGQLKDEPDKIWWVQQKVWRQRRALYRLNQRVFNQRVYLRLVNELGRIPTRDEYFKYHEGLTAEQADEIWRSVTE